MVRGSYLCGWRRNVDLLQGSRLDMVSLLIQCYPWLKELIRWRPPHPGYIDRYNHITKDTERSLRERHLASAQTDVLAAIPPPPNRPA